MFNFDIHFFERRQKHLLFIANRWYLRWLLGCNRLPKHLKVKYDKITPNSIHHNGTAEFFTRPRFAEALAYNLSPFCYFQELRSQKFSWRFSPAGLAYILLFGLLGKFAGLPLAVMGTVTDYFPSNDGEVGDNSSGTWATVHDATSGTLRTTNGNAYVQADYNSNAANMFLIRRYFSNFDTSGLGANATISSATWKLRSQADAKSGTGLSINVYDSTAQTTIDGTDYDLGGTTAQATAIAIADWGAADAWNTFTLNATGLSNINKTGITKFCLRDVTHDVANSSPGTTAYLYFGFHNSTIAGTAEDPYLSVTYSVPLVAETTYRVRAYATNSAGTSYGATVDVTTGAATNIKTYNTNLRANIKTINTNAIANVKSLNTNV